MSPAAKRRYVCLHGHFYQPPRESPWLEAIELQSSAYPYHDWNERIAAECYGPNANARVLDEKGRIVRLLNNYARISFDIGPTLMSWLEAREPEIHQAVLKADRASRGRFSGHGSAIAQAYNHMILPLANARDRRTQILWGARDFEHRFGRKPEGMWLPETAADTATLEALADAGIRFTILAPHQARRVRRAAPGAWKEVAGGAVDPRRAYAAALPSGRPLALFFYDGPVSRAVAFEGLLTRGELYAERLLGAFGAGSAQLVHTAVDGETYGHHHRFGEMALAFALETLEAREDVTLTNYGEFLDQHPPEWEAEIVEGSSWSCAHGVERWRSDCGCSSGRFPGWNQKWRAPLRRALDGLRDAAAPLFETAARALLKDPWAARDDYIAVILDRSRESVDAFLERHAARALADADRTRALRLLELQRHAQLMYTSCGWFFDDIGGIETVQVLRYAARVAELARELFDRDLETPFLESLSEARSNAEGAGNGRAIYEREAAASRVGLLQIGAHHGVTALFEEHARESRLYAYRLKVDDARRLDAEGRRLAVGFVSVESELTREAGAVSYAFLHEGGHHVFGGARPYQGRKAYEAMLWQITNAFSQKDFAGARTLIERHFPESRFSLKSLLRDSQRRIVRTILEAAADEAEAGFGKLYERHAETMRYLKEMGLEPPPAFAAAARFALNTRLRRALDATEPDLSLARETLAAMRSSGVAIDAHGLAFALEGALARLGAQLAGSPEDGPVLDRLIDAAELARNAPGTVDLWKAQKVCWRALNQSLPEARRRGADGDQAALAWAKRLESLSERLLIVPAEPQRATALD